MRVITGANSKRDWFISRYPLLRVLAIGTPWRLFILKFSKLGPERNAR